MQNILLTGIEFIPESEDNKLPKNMIKISKTQCRDLMAKRISDDVLDQIHEEIYRRETAHYTADIESVSSESESNYEE